jgi:hypothetical protein
MRNLRLFVALPCLLLLAAACGIAPGTASNNTAEPPQGLATVVQATFSAMTEHPASSPVALLPSATPVVLTPSADTGSISGSLTYPADSLPPMYVTAFQVGTKTYRYVITKAGQGTYEIDNLLPGKYNIVAYTVGGNGFPVGLAGGYTQAVPCGLATECANHTLIDVPLAAGQSVKGITPGDWNAPAGTFPVFPQQVAVPTTVGTAEATVSAANGSITGNLMFPASAIPALRIVASQVGSSTYYYTETMPGDSTYRIDNIPPGTYHVVAYSLPGNGFTGGITGGYSQMVPCGLTSSCKDHTLIDVVVTSGELTTGVDPNDYYAPAGTFPPDPVP